MLALFVGLSHLVAAIFDVPSSALTQPTDKANTYCTLSSATAIHRCSSQLPAVSRTLSHFIFGPIAVDKQEVPHPLTTVASFRTVVVLV